MNKEPARINTTIIGSLIAGIAIILVLWRFQAVKEANNAAPSNPPPAALVTNEGRTELAGVLVPRDLPMPKSTNFIVGLADNTQNPDTTATNEPISSQITMVQNVFDNPPNTNAATYFLGILTNLAYGCPVVCSDKVPIRGDPQLITNGIKENNFDDLFTMHRNLQWVQIELGGTCTIYYIKIWHSFFEPARYRDVIVQISNNAEFIGDVQTVFNNDKNNSSGLGRGYDDEYDETSEGLTIPVKLLQGRYIRAYSNGSTWGSLNMCSEVEVYGIPSK